MPTPEELFADKHGHRPRNGSEYAEAYQLAREASAKKPRHFVIGTPVERVKGQSNVFDFETRLRRHGSGFQRYHAAPKPVKASEIRDALAHVRSETVAIGIAGTLLRPMYEDDPTRETIPAHTRTFLGRVKLTTSAREALKGIPDEKFPSYRLWAELSDLTAIDWSIIETVYITERPPIPN